MSKDESTFEIDFGLEEEPDEVVEETKEEVFISNVLGPKGHLINSHNRGGALRILHFKCVADKDYTKGSRFILCKLPQSQIRLLGYMSRITSNISKFVVGWSSFTGRHREKKPGLKDGILTDGTVLSRTPLESTVFDSLEGVEVYATALSDGSKKDYIEGIFIYIKK